VRFLVDAQLPARLARFLADAGHDTLHTTDLPDGNRTTDAEIATLAEAQDRVVVTKDRDFRDGHLLNGSPRQLLVVATGNVSNNALHGRACGRQSAVGFTEAGTGAPSAAGNSSGTV